MRKKILAILLALCTLALFCACADEEAPSKGLEFTLNDDGASYTLLSYGDCKDAQVVIPSEYKGLPVTAIGSYAFKKKRYHKREHTRKRYADSVRRLRNLHEACL